MKYKVIKEIKDSPIQYDKLKGGDVFEFENSGYLAIKVEAGHLLFEAFREIAGGWYFKCDGVNVDTDRQYLVFRRGKLIELGLEN